jgi:hypothetical protein
MPRCSVIGLAVLATLLAVLPGGRGAAAADGDAHAVDMASPLHHFPAIDPADLSDDRAEAIYTAILDDMLARYAMSEQHAARHYSAWRRYNRAPYRSDDHGDRFVNIYANGAARAFGREGNGDYPAGAVIAKDSFTVSKTGDAYAGALFVMEKLPQGSAPETGDWAYSMIMPDGSLFGASGTESERSVAFCADCHDKAPGGARLFYVPPAYRNPD